MHELAFVKRLEKRDAAHRCACYLFFVRKEKVTEKKSPAYVFRPMSLQVARCEKELGQFHWPQTLFSRRSLLYAFTGKILLRF
ncbi:MAG: hypothetical protein K2F84_07960 [Bacteroidales bacterium]|nr:hypothetical protein [Bacteroidales bacterium]